MENRLPPKAFVLLSMSLLMGFATAYEFPIQNNSCEIPKSALEDPLIEVELELLSPEMQGWLNTVASLPTLHEHIDAYDSFISQLKTDQFSLTGIPFLTEIPSLALDVIDARLTNLSKRGCSLDEIKHIKQLRKKISRLQNILYKKKHSLFTRLKHWATRHKRKLQGAGVACVCFLVWYMLHKRSLNIEKQKIAEHREEQAKKEREFTALMQGSDKRPRWKKLTDAIIDYSNAITCYSDAFACYSDAIAGYPDAITWAKHTIPKTNIIKRRPGMVVPHPWTDLPTAGRKLSSQQIMQAWLDETEHQSPYSFTILPDATFIEKYGSDKSLYHSDTVEKAVIPLSIAQHYTLFYGNKDFVEKQGKGNRDFTVHLPQSLKDVEAFKLFLALLTSIVDKSVIAFEEEYDDDIGKFLTIEHEEEHETVEKRIAKMQQNMQKSAPHEEELGGLDEGNEEDVAKHRALRRKELLLGNFVAQQKRLKQRAQAFYNLVDKEQPPTLEAFRLHYTKYLPLDFGRKHYILEKVCAPFLREGISHVYLMQVIRVACQSSLCEMYPFLAWLYVRLGGHAQDSALQAVISPDFINEVRKHYFYVHGVTFDATPLTVTLTDLIDYDMFSKPEKPFAFTIGIQKYQHPFATSFDIAASLDVSLQERGPVTINLDGLQALLEDLLITTIHMKGKLFENHPPLNRCFNYKNTAERLRWKYGILMKALENYHQKNIFIYDESRQNDVPFKYIFLPNGSVIIHSTFAKVEFVLPKPLLNEELHTLHLYLPKPLYSKLPLDALKDAKKLTELFIHIDNSDDLPHEERAKIVEHIKKVVHTLASTMVLKDRPHLAPGSPFLALSIHIITPYGRFEIMPYGEQVKTSEGRVFDITLPHGTVIPYGKVFVTPTELSVLTPHGKVTLSPLKIQEIPIPQE